MSTETSSTPGAGHRAAFPDGLRLGAVDLTVTDLARSIAYYEDVVGLVAGEPVDGVASLGAGVEPLVVLHEDRAAQPAGRHAGLFHFALLHPTRADLAHAALRIAARGRAARRRVGPRRLRGALPARPRRQRDRDLRRPRPLAVAAAQPIPAQKIGMYTIPLDLRDLVATVEGAEPQEHAGDGLVMGHVHLHVGDIARAVAFYEALGMEQMAEMPSAAFLAAGGYHHHLGVNTWQGEGVGPAPPGTVGLRRWTIVVPQAADVAATAARLRDAGVEVREEGGAIVARDPWETELVVRAD